MKYFQAVELKLTYQFYDDDHVLVLANLVFVDL